MNSILIYFISRLQEGLMSAEDLLAHRRSWTFLNWKQFQFILSHLTPMHFDFGESKDISLH